MSASQEVNFTFADIMCWDGPERMELINGVPVMMSAPSSAHQYISTSLSGELYYFLKGKKCTVYSAPYNVRLFEKNGDLPENVDTVLEPDISVICDPNKQDKLGCKGAPDMIAEIVSPSSRINDRMLKFKLYQRAGVREYWIIEPEQETVEVFLLDSDGVFVLDKAYKKTECAKVNVLQGCVIDLKDIFPPDTDK